MAQRLSASVYLAGLGQTGDICVFKLEPLEVANMGSALNIDRLITVEYVEVANTTFSHVFRPLTVFENSSENIFTRTSS